VQPSEVLPRPRHLERVQPLIGTPRIKLITGQRRAGKSCILRLLAERMRSERPQIPMIYLDKELSSWDSVVDAASLEAAAKAVSVGSRVAASTRGSRSLMPAAHRAGTRCT
jgi:predicted AAA+ superfamily ATPase